MTDEMKNVNAPAAQIEITSSETEWIAGIEHSEPS